MIKYKSLEVKCQLANVFKVQRSSLIFVSSETVATYREKFLKRLSRSFNTVVNSR